MTVVIVGGGIAGILSALILKQKFETVYLIEKESELGGLLRSFENENGISFDYGTHLLRDTGVEKLDQLLYGEFDPKKWQKIGNLKGGGYFGSKYNGKTAFLDARLLPENIYNKGIVELLNSSDPSKEYLNLDEELRGTFGDTFTKYIFQPILERKYFGCDLKELVAGSHNYFQLGRLIGLTAQATREVKKSNIFDKKFAFHSYNEGVSNLSNYYPISGGIGQWIKELNKKMLDMGIFVLTGNYVKKIIHKNSVINKIILNNGTLLDCEYLVWTIPVLPCIKACNLSLPIQTDPPIRLNTILLHMVFDRPFKTDVYYVQCHEADFCTFRITLYPNLQKSPNNSNYNLTVEVISKDIPDLKFMLKTIQRELLEIGIVEPESNLIYHKIDIVKAGFPLMTHQFITDAQTQLSYIQEKLQNATFFGKGAGSHFLMNQVLVDVYEQLL